MPDPEGGGGGFRPLPTLAQRPRIIAAASLEEPTPYDKIVSIFYIFMTKMC